MNMGEQITGNRTFENNEEMFNILVAAEFQVNEA